MILFALVDLFNLINFPVKLLLSNGAMAADVPEN